MSLVLKGITHVIDNRAQVRWLVGRAGKEKESMAGERTPLYEKKENVQFLKNRVWFSGVFFSLNRVKFSLLFTLAHSIGDIAGIILKLSTESYA